MCSGFDFSILHALNVVTFYSNVFTIVFREALADGRRAVTIKPDFSKVRTYFPIVK